MLRNAAQGTKKKIVHSERQRSRVHLYIPVLAMIGFAILSPICWQLRSSTFFVHEAAGILYLGVLLYFLVLLAWVALGRRRLFIAGLSAGALFVIVLWLGSWNVGKVISLTYHYTPTQTSQTRMAVLGFFCYPTPTEFLDTFVITLRATGSHADVFIFCDKNPTAYEAAAKRLNFTLVSFEWRRPIHPKLYDISSLRFRLYERLLQETEGHFDFVMFCDVRDVFFQQDPLLLLSDNSSLVFAGENSVIQLPNLNAQWIAQCVGHAGMNRVQGQQVSCSGTVLGPIEPMLQYLAQHIAATGVDPFCASQGVDQGVHNWVVWTGGLRSRIEDWECGRILTADSTHGIKTKVAGGRRWVLNCHGEPYAVVHQWNRCKDRTHPHPTLDPSSPESCRSMLPNAGAVWRAFSNQTLAAP